MHGSYNWTPRANNNEENLATTLDHELVTKFAKGFMELYNLNKDKLEFMEVSYMENFKEKEYKVFEMFDKQCTVVVDSELNGTL